MNLHSINEQARKQASQLEQDGRGERGDVHYATSTNQARLVLAGNPALRPTARQSCRPRRLEDVQETSGRNDGSTMAASVSRGLLAKLQKIKPN